MVNTLCVLSGSSADNRTASWSSAHSCKALADLCARSKRLRHAGSAFRRALERALAVNNAELKSCAIAIDENQLAHAAPDRTQWPGDVRYLDAGRNSDRPLRQRLAETKASEHRRAAKKSLDRDLHQLVENAR